MTRAEIHDMVVSGIASTFNIDPARITLDANLMNDLDIDSIDAVDLASRLQRTTGTRLTPEQFKSVRTVGDLIDALESLLPAASVNGPASAPGNDLA